MGDVGGPVFPGIAGKVALVLGSGGGIGAAVAERFAAAGAEVVLHARSSTAATDAAAARIAAAGGAALPVAADLSDPSAGDRVVGAAIAWRGRLDVLVNAAGIQPVKPLAELTDGDWRAVLDTDLGAAVRCTAAAARVMLPGASVVHIASIEGSQPAAGHAHYCAAKAALIMFARSAALELGPKGLRINTVSPGLISRQDLAEAWPEGVRRWQAAAPLGRLGTPRDVADACLFLASPFASWITGHDLVVDGGVSSHPTW
ncbi:SDR family NAD(P)-dependent oxidoreductase [Kitasatospora sp. NPDC048365]|uniref:SDR family NAD(P)-dependent oxidoreductase n=1 Tax=Kitasatospora sp. NPDC048365 TaxID=3364050 RepID=UPI003723C79D